MGKANNYLEKLETRHPKTISPVYVSGFSNSIVWECYCYMSSQTNQPNSETTTKQKRTTFPFFSLLYCLPFEKKMKPFPSTSQLFSLFYNYVHFWLRNGQTDEEGGSDSVSNEYMVLTHQCPAVLGKLQPKWTAESRRSYVDI